MKESLQPFYSIWFYSCHFFKLLPLDFCIFFAVSLLNFNFVFSYGGGSYLFSWFQHLQLLIKQSMYSYHLKLTFCTTKLFINFHSKMYSFGSFLCPHQLHQYFGGPKKLFLLAILDTSSAARETSVFLPVWALGIFEE